MELAEYGIRANSVSPGAIATGIFGKMNDDTSIIDYMIERVSKDAEFRKRQSTMGRVASLLKAVGILNLTKKFPNFLPYMKLSFSKST